MHVVRLAAIVPDLRLDERLALSLLLIVAASLVHAFSYMAAEGAHPSQRWVFRRAADALAIVALYSILRVWT